jgi:hypothetical protein
MSWGCQGIAGDKYWDATKDQLIDDYKNVRYEYGKTQGAYNDFLKMVKSGVFANSTIKYNLINKSKIRQSTYNYYQNKLSR